MLCKNNVIYLYSAVVPPKHFLQLYIIGPECDSAIVNFNLLDLIDIVNAYFVIASAVYILYSSVRFN